MSSLCRFCAIVIGAMMQHAIGRYYATDAASLSSSEAFLLDSNRPPTHTPFVIVYALSAPSSAPFFRSNIVTDSVPSASPASPAACHHPLRNLPSLVPAEGITPRLNLPYNEQTRVKLDPIRTLCITWSLVCCEHQSCSLLAWMFLRTNCACVYLLCSNISTSSFIAATVNFLIQVFDFCSEIIPSRLQLEHAQKLSYRFL